MQSLPKISLKKKRKVSWFEQVMALLAMINFILVLFNSTYTRWRDFYFDYFPQLTQLYDPIKGIEPHRDTQQYLNTVQALQEQVVQTGLNSTEVTDILQTLQNQSTEIINTNPFEIAGKTGTLEKIKNRIRDRTGIDNSSKEAFNQFWSIDYLNQQGFSQELNWFNSDITPLMASNYYRGLGEDGQLLSYFLRLDLPFMIIFFVEYLARTYWISRRFKTFNLKDAMLWRWYDLLLFTPFWRWLRVIPVLIRLDQAGLIDVERVRNQAIRIILTNFAQELTEVVIIQSINQLQNAVQSGELSEKMLNNTKRQYIDLNNINEVEAIATHLVQATVYHVIPKLQPDIKEILNYTAKTTLDQSPLYQQVKTIPGLQNLPQQMMEQWVNQLSELATGSPQMVYEAVKKAMEDPEGVRLSNRLVKNFTQFFSEELQQEQSLEEIESLLVDFLEEFKINYVQRVDAENYEDILAETQHLRRITEGK